MLVGVGFAVALGGRLRHLPSRRLRWASLPLVAIALYWAPALLGASPSAAVTLLLASYAVLSAFAVANLRVVGMAVVLTGLLANAAVILVNGAMPVDPAAVVAAGLARPDDLEEMDLGPARRWEGPSDRLGVLGDIIPVPPLGEVVSFGDLVLAAGLADVAFRLLRPAGRLRRRAQPRPRAGPAYAGSEVVVP